jgi:class 3 adenylate cyclase
VLARGADDANIAVQGLSTNLAARLQTAAAAGEILLSEEAHRRLVRPLAGLRLEASREELELKGFEGRTVAYRLAGEPGAALR